MARTKPEARMAAKMQEQVPVDYEGMDPEMAKTIKGQAGNVMKQKTLYAGENTFKDVKKGGSSTAPKKRAKWFGIF